MSYLSKNWCMSCEYKHGTHDNQQPLNKRYLEEHLAHMGRKFPRTKSFSEQTSKKIRLDHSFRTRANPTHQIMLILHGVKENGGV